MKILILEDDFETANNYQAILGGYNGHECTICNDIITFDYFLYENPDSTNYDYFIIDLSLNRPADISDDVLNKWGSSIGVEFKTTILTNISVNGWDYFIYRICVNEKTKNILDKFILISGYKDYIPKEEFDKAKHFLIKGMNNLNEITSIIK